MSDNGMAVPEQPVAAEPEEKPDFPEGTLDSLLARMRATAEKPLPPVVEKPAEKVTEEPTPAAAVKPPEES